VNEDSTDKHADAPLYHNELLTTPHRNKINKFKNVFSLIVYFT